MKTKHAPFCVTLGVTVAFLTASSTPAESATVLFTYEGTIDTWVVPETGIYDITAYGAQGGAALDGFGFGGLGAEISGSMTLTAGTVLSILVGGSGIRGQFGSIGSGGGGSFVVGPGNAPLVIAGGGGGGSENTPGGPGLTGTTGGGFFGGTNGSGGGAESGAGGGGLLSDGGDGANGGNGGRAFIYGGQGGTAYILGAASGGFGGGGASAFVGFAGGGGGGYSGGSSAHHTSLVSVASGGGGSYLAVEATDTFAASGVRMGNGLVTIEQISISVPEPSTWTIVGLGIAALLASRRRRNA